MPLPDERPRQSVANLIGKFETQSKHLSPSQSNPSRTSSVVSHITGDSSKEEIKEKREWPPKSMLENASPGPSRLIPLAIDVDGRKAFVKSESEARVATQVLHIIRQQEETQNEANTVLENWRKDLPQPPQMEPELTTPKSRDPPSPVVAPPVQKVLSAPPTPKTPPVKTSATKVPTSASSKSVGTPVKIQAKPSTMKPTPPRQSLTPATSVQALKPQFTGQSVASSASKRTLSKASATPKTPSRTETRSKTPTSTPRPKTPSSGLFAPTAASLAKARNVPPPLPPPVKKATVSSDAMDRLSRPTAASLSRVKTGPVSAASTAKSPPRISSIKSKSTSSPSKSPQTKVKRDATIPQAPDGSAVVPAVASVAIVAAAEAIPEQVPVELTTNGHPVSEGAVTEVSTNSQAEQTHPEAETEALSGDVTEPDVNDEVAAPAQTPADPDCESEACNPPNGAVAEETAPKTNLEDIVNLLETAPVLRPSTEELSEIPDEDDK